MSVQGLDDVLRRMGVFEQEMERQAREIVSATALGIHGHAVKEIQRGKKSGKLYPKANKVHQASATGEAPATDTGALVSSLQLKGAGTNTMHVYTNLTYAPFLEFGTSRMGERPFMRPALQANKRPFEKAVQEMLKNVKRKLN